MAELRPNTPARAKVLSCDHPSHMPLHHNDDIIRKCGESLLLSALVVTNSKGHQMSLRWTGHLRLADHGDHEEGRRLTSIEMTRLLGEFRQDAAQFIVPQHTANSLPEMRCFDPNRCSCLHYPGEDTVPGGWWMGPFQTSHLQSCRADTAFRIPGLAPVSEGNATSGLGNIGSHTSRAVLRLTDHFAAGWDQAFEPRSGTTIAVKQCAYDMRCIQITYRRTIALNGKKLTQS